MLITTNSSEQKSKATFILHGFPILCITVYSYLYYFWCLAPFLWTATYYNSDSYIAAFSCFPRIQNNISRKTSVVFFRRESRVELIEPGKREALFSIIGPYTMSTFSYNKASNRISPTDHQSWRSWICAS